MSLLYLATFLITLGILLGRFDRLVKPAGALFDVGMLMILVWLVQEFINAVMEQRVRLSM